MRIGKNPAIVGLIAGLVAISMAVVVLVLKMQSGYPDETRDGDLIVHGSGWTQRAEGGRLFLLICDQRAPGMQFVRAAPIAIVLDLPSNVAWLPGEQPQNKPVWVYRSSLAWKVEALSQPSATVEMPYELDGRQKSFSIAGRTFDLSGGNVFHLAGEDELEPIIHQREFDPGFAAVSPDRFEKAYREHFPEN